MGVRCALKEQKKSLIAWEALERRAVSQSVRLLRGGDLGEPTGKRGEKERDGAVGGSIQRKNAKRKCVRVCVCVWMDGRMDGRTKREGKHACPVICLEKER